jgi:hypothetical protein
LAHLEGIAREKSGVPELPEGEERTLQSTLRRGWYFGAEGFREAMLKRLDKLKGKGGKAHRGRSGYSGQQARDHGEAEAKRLIKRGLALAGLPGKELAALRKNDWRKRAIGRVVRRRTVQSVTWIAAALHMGNPNRAASLVRSDPARDWGADWKRASRLVRELEKE